MATFGTLSWTVPKTAGAGTGLGLSISRSLARQRNGDLCIDLGAPDTTFVLRLPRR